MKLAIWAAVSPVIWVVVSACASVVVRAAMPAVLIARTWVELRDCRSVVERPAMTVVDKEEICWADRLEIVTGEPSWSWARSAPNSEKRYFAGFLPGYAYRGCSLAKWLLSRAARSTA